MLIIGLAGPQFSGKTLVASHLCERHNAWVFDSTWIREEVIRRGMPLERASYNAVTKELHALRGDGFIAREMLWQLPSPKPRLAVHDGLRLIADVPEHRQATDFRLIYLESSLECRFARARGVVKNGRRAINTMEEFMADEQLESEREIPLFKSQADLVLASERRDWLLNAVDRQLAVWLK